MNLRDLDYLVAVAEERHFGRAARRCHVGQPTLSTQIRKLEAELGVTLIERSPRQVLLTEAGEHIVERARAILREADAIRELARRAADPASGTVRVGLFPTLGPYLLPHIVPVLRDRFPRLELLLVEEKTEDVLRLLDTGRLDAGLLALPIDDERLHVEPLFEEQFLLAVPHGHRLAGSSEPIDPSALVGEDVLLLADGHCLRDQALSICRLVGATERSDFRATSLETLRHMVAAGVGITLLPELSVQPPVARTEHVVLRRFTDPVPSRTIALAWRRSSALAAFLPLLADAARAMPNDLVRMIGGEGA